MLRVENWKFPGSFFLALEFTIANATLHPTEKLTLSLSLSSV